MFPSIGFAERRFGVRMIGDRCAALAGSVVLTASPAFGNERAARLKVVAGLTARRTGDESDEFTGRSDRAPPLLSVPPALVGIHGAGSARCHACDASAASPV